ncbi:uncharacterized protein LOC116177635 isoform X2 [Photinus pyralis]|uniref:uncharacterized protein LOC116177635 isoform X2 n=1 Tax=Photinus pyralis TaxID=7054 RepID=UPI00126700F4|nr:uncharacterized protein LOC116177635 isoform X2 [Photinus pyralis]
MTENLPFVLFFGICGTSRYRQAAVPPPPPGATGHLPAGKLKSEISDRRVEPPLCVQNAMLTKDKKPFTYTPGGIDLSEIKSPRMARRLERNAMNEGVSTVPQPQHYPTGPLPPSALAAMQPQLPVQVFPSGGVPQLPHSGAPAPPPPPPKAPPMKTSPLPTDCYERPDMTKIIPDNPMALLRKTAGPVVKQDPILNKCRTIGSENPTERAPPHPQNTGGHYPQVQPTRQISTEVPPPKPISGVGAIYVPPINNRPQPAEPSPPISHKPQLVETSPPASYSPPAYYKRQPSTPQPESPKPQPQSPDSLNSPKPSLSKAPTPWLTQRRQTSQDHPEWAVNDHRVQSPPAQQEPQQQPWTPPEKQEPPPQAKPVRPWQQQQQQQQPEMQPWQHRQVSLPEQYGPPPTQYQRQQPQQFRPEPPAPSPQKQGGVRRQIDNRERPQEYFPAEKTEIVIVNDPPMVFQHPGQTQQRVTRQVPYQQQEPGVRVIPMQVEGRATNGQVRSPQHNSDARSFNRQNSTPTQSNTFRVLQKITQTDGDDDDYQIATEHSPKMYHQFPQQQQRKWDQGDQALMNSFRQESHLDNFENPRYRGGHIPSKLFWMLDDSGFDENNTLHNEVDPRYRGPNIPSKAFKLLQNMTSGQDQTDVPQEYQQSAVAGPKVRTIPIQIEGNGSVKNYVPPSEQTVQEPKKYMGSSIPSRSFKMLQAMTAPDECANPGQASENYTNDPSSYTQWGFDPNQHPPPPYCFDPYWSYYSQNFPPNGDGVDPNQNPRMTPVPFPYYYPPYYYGQKEKANSSESVNKRSQGTTPVPWQSGETTHIPQWPYYYPGYADNNTKPQNPESEDQQNCMYPQYWNPYYYGYYYGAMYPPPYSPYPFYPPHSDAEEVSGYSSNEEMAYYGARFAVMPPTVNGSAAPKPEVPKKSSIEKTEVRKHELTDDDGETSDSDAEMIGYEVCRKTPGLQAIRSVSDIKVYEAEESSQCSDDESEDTTEGNEDSSSLCAADDVIPHQLSVIFEESERTESVRLGRESSVSTTISEGTATIENSEDEGAEESDSTVFVKFVGTESEQTAKLGEIENCDNEVPYKTDSSESFKDASNGYDDLTHLAHSESGIDFWAHLAKDASRSDVFVTPKKLVHERIIEEESPNVQQNSITSSSNGEHSQIAKEVSIVSSSDEEKSEVDFWAEIITDEDPTVTQQKQDARSTCSSHSNLSGSGAVPQKDITPEDNKTELPESENQNCDETPLSIQERIQMLQESIAAKKKQLGANENKAIKERKTELQITPDTDCSRKSSLKSCEECSEEEGDSGVTSDVSRHISEVETDLDFLEAKQSNKYQRASTHSRLFKLLQDECDNEDEVDEVKSVDACKSMLRRRDQLSLPLRQPGSDPESFSSSGFTSPGSPTINDRLVSELIQSLLMKKQGRVFKNVTMEKLQAAALRILQEDMDGLETLSSSEEGSFLSSKRGEVGSSPTTAQYLNDYNQYYESWNEAAKYCEGQQDILPSKAFRLLQEHSVTNKTGAFAGLLARCPRVVSNKNVQKELLKLIESAEAPSPIPESSPFPNANEAANAS